MHSWLLLTAAILFEVAGTTAMKLSDGFTKLLPSTLLVVFYLLSFTALTFTLKKMDISVAYAVWSAAGTALIATIGIVFFKETLNAVKVGSLLLIIVGVIGLHMSNRA